MMMDCAGGGGWMMGTAMTVSALLFVTLVVAGLWLVGRAISGGPSRASDRPGSSARTILEERFARGEIDRDEFEERSRILEGDERR
jgi:putative membrane protein